MGLHVDHGALARIVVAYVAIVATSFAIMLGLLKLAW